MQYPRAKLRLREARICPGRHARWRHPSTLRCQSALAWKNCCMLLHPPCGMLAGSRAEALFFGSSFAWSSSDLGNTEAACGTTLEVPVCLRSYRPSHSEVDPHQAQARTRRMAKAAAVEAASYHGLLCRPVKDQSIKSDALPNCLGLVCHQSATSHSRSAVVILSASTIASHITACHSRFQSRSAYPCVTYVTFWD